MSLFTVVISCALLISSFSVFGQSEKIAPVSFVMPTGGTIETYITGTVNREALLAEEFNKWPSTPFRFGYPFDVSLDMGNAGTWEDLSGGRIWRLRIECPGAFSINLLFDRFYIPSGAALWIYDEEGYSLLGPFTEENNKKEGVFATGLVRGSVCTVEYYEPDSQRGKGRIRICRIVYGYKDIFRILEKQNFLKAIGDAGFCEVNVACPEGEEWRDQARAVAMVIVEGGISLCSGVLLNNVRQDWKPYFLTAQHCLKESDPKWWVVVFNFESPTCENKSVSMDQTISGASLVSADTISDFALLELSRTPPKSFGVYYAGWSATGDQPQQAACIHHPRGDLKKISFDFDPPVSSTYPWNTEEIESHWKVLHWDIGSTEPGSSGAPLFDENHRVIGQLTGGLASCTIDAMDYFGKLAVAWEGGGTPAARLKDWLDPENTGTLVMDGAFAPNDPPNVHFVSPKAESFVSGVVSLEVEAEDDVGIRRVDFFVNEEFIGSANLEPYHYTWDTQNLEDGAYRVEAVARDVTGLTSRASITVYRRRVRVATGDANCDGNLNVADAVCLLVYLFGPEGRICKSPCCEANMDTNDDDRVDISDAVGILGYLFSGSILRGPDGEEIFQVSCRPYEEADVLLPCANPCR